MGQKIELHWMGKENDVSIQPCILREDISFGYGDKEAENMLIQGDNLLALHALESTCSEKIKCIYIDPPYNTETIFEYYDDSVEHSAWLSLMRERLLILQKLLATDGIICVQIDDNEMAYLQIVMDEIFGRGNRINTICVNMSNMSGPKVNGAIQGKRFPKLKEYILLYAKDRHQYSLQIPKYQKKDWDEEYNYIIPELTRKDIAMFEKGDWTSFQEVLKKCTLHSLKEYMRQNNIQDEQWKKENAYRICASKPNKALRKIAITKEVFSSALALIETSTGLHKIIKTDFNRDSRTARIEMVFAEKNRDVYFGDHWDDIVTTGGIAQEGGVHFPKSKKPEKLLHRILETTTQKDDWVLDAFLGSGTTAAVAHKMGRKWIGIELGAHAKTHCAARLRAVIDGEQGGISRLMDWNGGGGYRYYHVVSQ